MKRIFGFLACSLLSLGIIAIAARPMVIAQEAGKAAAKSEKGGEAKGAKKAGSGDRLPANYGKIGVSEDQRKKIYEIQGKYKDQIAALQKQLADVRTKEAAEVEAVLTPEQKKALQAANDESNKKAADKKKSGENEKVSEKTEKGAK